jgi:hypothetical protein
MVSENHPNHHNLCIPDSWDSPQFPLAARVRARIALPSATRTQTGEISGLEYLQADSFLVSDRGLQPGWHYFVQVDADDPWYSTSPVLCVAESDLSQVTINSIST